jgi:hypothetical protein
VEENKCEQYLIELKYSYQAIGPAMWLIDEPSVNLTEVVAAYADPLVVVRAAVMNVPEKNRLELFTTLLELNNDILHGAYAIEKNQIILVDTLEYDTMDLSEFRATLEAFGLALAQHYPILSKYR